MLVFPNLFPSSLNTMLSSTKVTIIPTLVFGEFLRNRSNMNIEDFAQGMLDTWKRSALVQQQRKSSNNKSSDNVKLFSDDEDGFMYGFSPSIIGKKPLSETIKDITRLEHTYTFITGILYTKGWNWEKLTESIECHVDEARDIINSAKKEKKPDIGFLVTPNVDFFKPRFDWVQVLQVKSIP